MKLISQQLLIRFVLMIFIFTVAADVAEAGRTITSVALDGSASGTLTVAPSALIGAEVFVTTDGRQWWADNDWESTSWKIGSGPEVCVNHGNHNSAGDYSELFDVTAPASSGTYTAEFIAYSDNGCSTGASDSIPRQIEVAPAYPSVDAISLASFDPTTANTSVAWSVEFSESVTAVDDSDFELVAAGGTAGSSITEVSGSGTTWTVTADTGTSDTGTLGLNLIDNDTIINISSVPLGGVGAGNGDYAGPVYTLVPPVPLLNKVASTSAAAVGDVVTFTISVSNPHSDPLVDVVLTDVLPTEMTYVTHVASVGSVNVSGQTVTWTINNLPGSSSVQLTLAATMSQQGILTNTVTSPSATSASATVLVLASAVTHFRMDEPVASWVGTTGEVVDSGGTALHGTWQSTSGASAPVDPMPAISDQHSTVIGGFCNAASFDGSSVVEVADSSLFDYTTELSASTWIYPTAYPSEYSSILSNDVNYEFHLNSSGNLYWWWQASTLTSAATIPLNQWTHVAITLDSSSGVRRQRIYINGLQDSNTNNWQGTLATNNCKVHIGGDVQTGSCDVISGRNFHGMIDEVKLYGFEMTQAQVQADMTLGRNCSGTFDHIRIEHDGIGSICAPERVTIKACLDSDCTTLFPGNVTVNLSPTGWVGGNTFTFSGGIASRQLSWGTPGNITLGTSSISPTPAISTQCYNGSTQTCTLNFADVSCAFDAVETGALPQTPIFTKLSGVSFDIDVLALLDASTINTNYANTVNVDLVDSAGSACPTGTGLISAKNITFTSGDLGRMPVTFNYPSVARNVKVRARVSVSAPACSNDNFAIRPQTFLVTSADADDSATVVAGEIFNLTATAIVDYDGTPSINSVLATGTPVLGNLTGSFSPALSSSGTATGVFTYSEVGHFDLLQNAVYDSTFTLVDQPDDCDTGFSNTLSIEGKYGCSFGSSFAGGFGRFIPHHFEISVLDDGTLSDACSVFTYTGQDFTYGPDIDELLTGELIDYPKILITPMNAETPSKPTKNYRGAYDKLSVTDISMPGTIYDAVENGVDGVTPLALKWTPGTPDLTNNNNGSLTLTLGNDSYYYERVVNALIDEFTADFELTISSIEDSDSVVASGVPYDFKLDAQDPIDSSEDGVKIRYGQMQLQNAYGPETLPLTVPVFTEYFNGSSFVLNDEDICTGYDSLNLLPLSPISVGSGQTTASGSGTLSLGFGNSLSLSAPGAGNDGSVDLEYNLDAAGLEWLKPGGHNPTAKATFGIYKGNQRLIYMRESVW
jgi:MSHA biogenesis protein MshQ